MRQRIESVLHLMTGNVGNAFVMMDQETFEQIPVEEDRIPNSQFIKEEDLVEILYNTADDSILAVEIPATVELAISYTEPGIKGDTATNTLKPATVETGAEVRVPLFINIGDKVKIDTSTGSYMERVKQ